MQLNIKKITKSKSGQKIEIDISPEDIQMAERDMKNILNITSYQRNANQNNMRYHLTLLRMLLLFRH